MVTLWALDEAVSKSIPIRTYLGKIGSDPGVLGAPEQIPLL